MKTKRTPCSSPTEPQSKPRGGRGDEVRWRARIWMAAILLAVTFLAGECANLIPLE